MRKKSKLALFLALVFTISCSFIGCGKEKENSELQKVRLNEVVRSVFYAPMYVAISEGFFEEEGLEIDLSTGQEEKENSELQKVRLNEVVRSVFYAPMYVAISEGFFEEEGLEIDLSTGQGADKVMQNVLSNNADIGFCGPEQVIYIYNQGREDYPVLFAQLTQKDGSFLVGRNDESNFTWEQIKGKKLIGGRPGGVPEMALEYVMRNHGIIPGKDVEMVTNIDFTATAGAFKAGSGEYVALFEPTASMLEKEGSGKIVASIGKDSGKLAYTCFFSTKSEMALEYVMRNHGIIPGKDVEMVTNIDFTATAGAFKAGSG